MGDVDPDPLPPELLRRVDRRAAAAEGIQDDVAGVGGGRDDAFEEGEGLLGGVAEAFLGLRVEGGISVQTILNWLHLLDFLQITLRTSGCRRRVGRYKSPFSWQLRMHLVVSQPLCGWENPFHSYC